MCKKNDLSGLKDLIALISYQETYQKFRQNFFLQYSYLIFRNYFNKVTSFFLFFSISTCTNTLGILKKPPPHA